MVNMFGPVNEEEIRGWRRLLNGELIPYFAGLTLRVINSRKMSGEYVHAKSAQKS
jgi:hypothetical protein